MLCTQSMRRGLAGTISVRTVPADYQHHDHLPGARLGKITASDSDLP